MRSSYGPIGCLFAWLWATTAAATTHVVPDDFPTIQAALNAAVAGDTIRARQQVTPYGEKIVFPASGNAIDGYITLEPFPGDQPVLDGTSVPGANMVLIENRSYVKLIGFEIRNNLGVNDGSGVRVLGAGSHIEIRDNRIHDIRGDHAMGITVYATEPTPISDLIIDGNEIYDCEPYQSEALTLNGNVTDFEVTNNVVRDVNNIGIDFIGGETDIQPDPTRVVRDGVCRGNQVLRANEQGGGFAGGIYVDGGRDIVIENNLVTESDLGIEIGAENSGIVTSGIVVRNNLVYANLRAGIVFGGFKASVGRTEDCSFLNNTTYKNDTLGEGFGELWIQFAEDNEIRNNVFYSTAQNILLYSEDGNVNNALDYNLWFTDAGAAAARFVWQETEYTGFASYQVGSGQDSSSVFTDPALAAPGSGDFHLTASSPAINAGDPAFVPAPGEVDIDGGPRVNGSRVDAGADETTACGDGNPDPGEQCDDGNPTEGDGCDSNCTATACGNGIVTLGEQCDDGNSAAGDCCSPACAFDSPGASCDDADPCSRADACDGAGACAGSTTPEPACHSTTESGASTLRLRRDGDATKDSILWKWRKGEATDVADFADPTADRDYTICLYDASADPQPRLRSDAPSGASWTPKSSGFRYKRKDAGGKMVMVLKAGAEGKAKIVVKGKGTGLSMPALPLTLPVTVQMKREGGGCWGATFSSAAENGTGELQATSD